MKERIKATGLPFSIVNHREVKTMRSRKLIGEISVVRRIAGWNGGGTEYIFVPNELGSELGYRKALGDGVRKTLDRGASE